MDKEVRLWAMFRNPIRLVDFGTNSSNVFSIVVWIRSAPRWYVFRAERYLRSTPHDSPALHQAEDMHAYLDGVGRSGKLEDWQFQQLVDALEILFVDTVKAPWASSFNWENWHAAGHSPTRKQPITNRKLTRNSRPVQHKPKLKTSSMGTEPDQGIMRKLVAEIRRRGYSIRTEQAYAQWVVRYLRFHDARDPAALGATAVTQFLEHLAVDRHVAASTQNQALNALVFLYSQILDSELGRLDDIVSC